MKETNRKKKGKKGKRREEKKEERMPANAVELVNLPGVAVKATISNIVWVGGGVNLSLQKFLSYVLFKDAVS